LAGLASAGFQDALGIRRADERQPGPYRSGLAVCVTGSYHKRHITRTEKNQAYDKPSSYIRLHDIIAFPSEVDSQAGFSRAFGEPTAACVEIALAVIKRQMYCPANADLLRAHVLGA
jgi:hypothetical protein